MLLDFNNKLILEWFKDISGAYDKTYTLPLSLNTYVFAGLTLRGTKTTIEMTNPIITSFQNTTVSFYAGYGYGCDGFIIGY